MEIEDKALRKAEIKAALEGLEGEIDGLIQMKNAEAFDAAVNALKDILRKVGYKEENGGFSK